MTWSKQQQSKGGKGVRFHQVPFKCPRCNKDFSGWEKWHVYLGHLGLHGLADKYFGGDIVLAQKHLRQNGLARQDPAPWNKAWPKYKPVTELKENGHAVGGNMAESPASRPPNDREGS